MNKQEFKRKLIDFFKRHDPKQVSKVDRIAKKFSGSAEIVFRHLTKKYAKKSGADKVVISEGSDFSIPGTTNSGHIPV